MKILIVDDEKLLRWSLAKTLQKAGYSTCEAGTLAEGKEMVVNEEPDIVLLDVNLPDGTGIDLLKWAKNAFPDMMFLIITAQGRIKDAVSALKLGAYDYLEKPLDMEDLIQHIQRVHDVIELKREIWRLSKSEVKEQSQILAASSEMLEVVRLAHTVAESGAQTILLLGESGCGKDRVAHYIHEHSSRRSEPFMIINCAALPETLLESELFGHEKGAFTDARTQKKGILELADRGTIFMDEIGEMAPAMQTKMLRVLEDWTFKRIGGNRDIHVDVRVITATNRNLEDMVKEKQFREDLYYRLNVFPITIPPLRERPKDVELLANHFINSYNMKFNKHVLGFTDEAMAALKEYSWPGNVRELRNVIERIMILQSGDTIDIHHLPMPGREVKVSREDVFPAGTLPLEEAERLLIERALAKTDGNVTQAAALLEVTRDTLRYKIKKHNL